MKDTVNNVVLQDLEIILKVSKIAKFIVQFYSKVKENFNYIGYFCFYFL